MIYENDEIRKEHGRFSARGLAATFLMTKHYHCRNIGDLVENKPLISGKDFFGVDGFLPLCSHIFLPTCMYEAGTYIPPKERSVFFGAIKAKIYDYSGTLEVIASHYSRSNKEDILLGTPLPASCRLYDVLLLRSEDEFFLYQFEKDPTGKNKKKKKKPEPKKLTIFDRMPTPI